MNINKSSVNYLQDMHFLQLTVPEKTDINLWAPCDLYIGQAFRYSLENAFYIFKQQIYFIV